MLYLNMGIASLAQLGDDFVIPTISLLITRGTCVFDTTHHVTRRHTGSYSERHSWPYHRSCCQTCESECRPT